jgi:hypothetical protein
MQNEPIEIYVSRDYANGIEPTTFQRAIPQELEGRVHEQDFVSFVDAVNEIYKEVRENEKDFVLS